ncbi:MAG: hypothetical protein US89_C0003G0034 [Candidatus Peregrinibacteria bacterium GW2011_GWF2_38_29]|nr:MAG: hypothetical protein US89_C0003G0034 [Candidatus Peregrinibacteria bacterium GW2011_GWF2_38_29]HBB02916.1 hypothetical protein [Candidatus Peregrinibacteria bacterium]
MALPNMAQWDQFEHPEPENMDYERVLHTIDRFLDDPVFPNRFQDLMENATSHVRESVANVLDPNRDARIDDPMHPHAGPTMSEQISTQSEGERRRENFEGGVRGWMRRVILRRPPRNAETLLPNTAADPNRGTRVFTRREVLGATYHLDPQYADRIMTDPADPRFAQFTQAREFLQQRLGREIWSERQAYPAMKWALSFIAGVQPNPPNPAFDINQFVTEAVGQQADYSAAVREAENAQNEFDLMTKRIDDASKNVDALFDQASALQDLCPDGYEVTLNRLNIRVNDLRALEVTRTNEMLAGANPAERSERKIIRDRVSESLKQAEDALQRLTDAKGKIDTTTRNLRTAITNLPAVPAPGTERQAVLDFIQNTMHLPVGPGVIAPADITDTLDQLKSYGLKLVFNRYASGLRADLKANLEHRKTTADKAKAAAESARENKFTPEELVYKLFLRYFTTRQRDGGFLNNDIPDHWIAGTPFQNKVRERALLAARFAISEAKDQASFQSNKRLADYVHSRRNGFSRVLSGVRSSWLGNKIATTFGRPEEVSFKEAMTRMRTVESDGKRLFARLDLDFKPLLTRGDFRKALRDKKVELDDLPKLAAYLEELLRGSDKLVVRAKDSEHVYRTIRNLKIVRQEIMHKQFLHKVEREPGSFNAKLVDLWKTEWKAEQALDWAAADEAAKREFITMLEKAHFSAEKKALRTEIIDKLSKGEITIDNATDLLDKQGFKVNRMTGAKLFARARAHGAKLGTVNVGRAAGNFVATKAAPVVNVVKKAPGAVLTYGVAKPLKFVGYTLPVGGAKLVYNSFKNVFSDIGSSFAETFGMSSSGGHAPKAEAPKKAGH